MTVTSGYTPIFAYGTLRYYDVLFRVLKIDPNSEKVKKYTITDPDSASLHDFKRFNVLDEEYPGMIPCTGSKVHGTLILGLSGSDIDLLDEYEGDEYKRVKQQVEYKDGLVECYVYEWIDSHDRLIEE